ncbi:MAG: hypothetical protein M1815_005631 [Lichina confinis]|nr:MAG: hypothetical protein M1815_005631 [Lichina confinis]
MSAHEEPVSKVSYEDLAELEKEFEGAELEILRNEILLTAPLYRKRAGLISQIPNFWSLVLEQAPQDIDQFIQPTDSHILLSCLKTIDVARFEVPPYAAEGATDGSPRSIAIRFTFKPNEWFEDEVLEKKFWYRRRRGPSAWAGLVSEPVRVRWKSKAQDPTGGLTDAAYALWQAEKRAQAEGAKKGEGRAEEKKGKGPNKKSKDLLPEHRELDKRSHASGQGAISFFTWFGYRGPNVTAEESAAAMQEERERRDKVKGGENPPPPEDGSIDDGDAEDGDDDGEHDELLWEVYPGGEELAISISEDLYPSALKYFITAQEEDRPSDDDFEDSGDEDGLRRNDNDDEENHTEEDEIEGAKATMLDLRELVNKPRSSTPDNKKTKKKYGWMNDDGDGHDDDGHDGDGNGNGEVDSDGVEDDRPRKRRARGARS